MKMDERLKLAMDYRFEDDDSGAASFKAYFKTLLIALWQQGEGFSGKRPFGNSDWQHNIYKHLVASGAVKGVIDDEGHLQSFDKLRADSVIYKLIVSLAFLR